MEQWSGWSLIGRWKKSIIKFQLLDQNLLKLKNLLLVPKGKIQFWSSVIKLSFITSTMENIKLILSLVQMLILGLKWNFLKILIALWLLVKELHQAKMSLEFFLSNHLVKISMMKELICFLVVKNSLFSKTILELFKQIHHIKKCKKEKHKRISISKAILLKSKIFKKPGSLNSQFIK